MAFARAFAVAAAFPAFYVLATTVLVIILVSRVLRTPLNLPPGPTGLPLVGSLHLLGALPHQSLAELAKQYGALMSLRMGQAVCIVASSPETAMEFLKKQDANFCARPPMRAGEVLFGPDILFRDSSPKWRHMRKLVVMELTTTKRLGATRHVREEEMAHLLRTLPNNREFEFRTHLGVLFTNIFSRLILNRRFSAPVGGHELTEEQMRETQNFREIMIAIPKCLDSFYPGDFIPALNWLDFQGLENHFQEIHNRMDAFATKIISEHQVQRQRGTIAEHERDLVHSLLDEMDNYDTVESGPQITMANVKAMIWDGFTGGTETTSQACEWVMSEVVCNPTVQSKAQAELDNVLGQHRRVQESDIPNLRYIQAVVKEGLRLHPAAPVLAPHQSISPCKAFGYDIPAKSHLFVNVWAIGRDPNVWKDPLEFNPERWLGPEALDATQGEFLPFGAGRRMCPGIALGTLTLEYCIASLLQAFEWSVTKNPGMAEGPGMGTPRAVPLRVIVKPRLPSEFYN